ncbi:Ig-like domain-containing protein [Roseimaritima sediminicola]|uniref:Ig-like domain-containing protein n=1 Tax=Roseimaritima sediminicola TaxID=2662066 RepID=UPI0012984FD1|nr:tandem-95 repeat protein [Roseimaritima sediminicola]
MPQNSRSSNASQSAQTRRAGRQLLAALLRRGEQPETRRGLQLETLEGRQMMAGDVELFATGSAETFGNAAASGMAAASEQAQGEAAQGEEAQGEPQPDLVAFAKLLKDQGVVFYGADWCAFCTEQKELFQDGAHELPFVEVTDGSRNLNAVGVANQIQEFPTWDFDANTRLTGVLTLQEIADAAGVAIPTSESPTFADIADQSVAIGSPIHIPIDAYDPNGQNLTVTATVEDPNLLEAIVLEGNRSVRFDMKGYGDMVFELFEQRAERPTSRFIELANSGFYDGLTLHRILDNFVLQGGDPNGDGTGGSSLGDFDDQFHPDLQHTTTGVLSYAKSTDDTNDSQFFITEGNQQGLDYQHSVFGQLVEGEDVREGISRVAVNNAQKGDPVTPVEIESVTVFEDNENSVVMLRPTGNGTGTTNVTFTVTDPDGNQYSQIVAVTVGPDTVNAQPYLEDIDPVVSAQGTPAQFQLESVDLEGDAVEYLAEVDSADTSGATVTVTDDGLVTVTPPSDYSGTVRVGVAVRYAQGAATPSVPASPAPIDIQYLDVMFSAGAPGSIDLAAASDTGSSSTDNVTGASELTFTVSGVTAGSTVELLVNDTVVGVGAATGSTVTITTGNFETLGSGTYEVVARQRGADGVNSPTSSPLTVVYDNVLPVAVGLPAGLQANVGAQYTADLSHPEEGEGLVYGLSNPPAGATIDPETGIIRWTPTEAQTGTQSFNVTMTDLAGNVRTQSIDINVEAVAQGEIILGVTDLDGNAISSITAGQEFLLTFSVRDARSFSATGVFAAYTDIVFDNDLARPVDTDPFGAGPDFPNTVGTVSDGLIDELGAFSNSFSGNGSDETLIATVRMRALQAGEATFVPDPADGSGTSFLLYDEDDETPTEAISYEAASVVIEAAFSVNDDQFTAVENSTDNTLDVLDNDQAAAGDTLTLVSVSTPDSGGQVTIDNGVVLYTPATDFTGTETFTYVARDTAGVQQSGTVSVTVSAQAAAPTAVGDTQSVAKDSTGNRLDVLANDGGENLTITAVGTPVAGGTVSIESGSGAVLYTPPAGFTGTDTFTYTISNGSQTSQASVVVNVSATNPPPTAVNDLFTVTEDAAEAEYDVLANDSNPDSSETFSLTSVGSSGNGSTVRLSDDGTKVVYKPAANFFGSEQITYTITDSNGASATGTITFNVTGVNDPPPAADVTKTITKGGSAQTVFNIADAGTNVDGPDETLTITAVGSTSGGGTVAISGDAITYTPSSASFTGTDTFTYTITDGSGSTASGTITVNVRDYVPRDFVITLPSSNMIIPYTARLVGTTDFGETVDLSVDAAVTGNQIVFTDQAPGNYRIEIPEMPFLIGGESAQTIEITSAADDGDFAQALPELGSLRPEFMSLRDFLGSTPKQSVFAAVAPGQSNLFVLSPQDMGDLSAPTVSLNAAGDQLTIEVTKADGTRDTRTVAINGNDADLEVRATSGDYRLVRVNLDDGTGGSSSAAAATQQAQGEQAQGEQAQGEQVSGQFANSEAAQGESPRIERVDYSSASASPKPTPGATGAPLSANQIPTVKLASNSSATVSAASEGSDAPAANLADVAQRRTAAIDSAMAAVATPGQQPTTAEQILTGADEESVDPDVVDDVLRLLSERE